MHGARKPRSIKSGEDHPLYVHGRETKKSRAIRSDASALFLLLRDVGDGIGMFIGERTRGRKPRDYK